MSKFWMVYNPKRQAPKRQHQTFGDASEEAARLAKLQPGDQFFILEALTVYVGVPQPAVVTKDALR
jgi:hypothetical protein